MPKALTSPCATKRRTMPMSLFLKTRVVLLASALVLALLAPLQSFGKKVEFVAYNCAITPPEGWSLVTNLPPQPGLFAVFRKADQKAMLLLMVGERNNPKGPLDERTVAEYEAGVESGGGGKRSREGSFRSTGSRRTSAPGA